MNYRSCMKLIGIKNGKRSKSGQNFGGCTGTCTGVTDTSHQRPTCIGTGPTCTGTCQHNATCTSTGPGCTGICEPKMPRMPCFCIIKPEFVHR